MTLSKKEDRLVKESAQEVGISYEKAMQLLEFYKLHLKESISTGKTIRIPMLGTFYPSEMKQRNLPFKKLVTEETIVQERKQRQEYYKNKFNK